MRAAPEELTTLISDLETFLRDGLKGENLSKKAKDKREAFIKRIKEVKLGFPHDFKEKSGEESSDDEEEVDSSNNDGGSLQSERTDREEEPYEGSHQSPPMAAQDLQSILMSGYLEKRRKDHSFFGQEWQKRWCALSYRTFYYYGHEKDKQQKGEFGIDGYNVKMNTNLRKDAKKDFCFEVSAPDKRDYQFCASSAKEAKEWVKWIDLVLKDQSGIIQEEEEEEEVEKEKEEEQLMYDDVGLAPDTDIYEVLPDTNTDYQNYYQGLWDCVGDHPDELSFKRGDTIYILSKPPTVFSSEELTMELVGWSLDVIDKMFSTERAGSGEPACPPGTLAAGYALDPWRKWRPVCLTLLSVEDVEDIYIIGLLITGMLLFGVGSLLFYRKIQPTGAALLEVKKLPVTLHGLARMPNTQTQAVTELNRNIVVVWSDSARSIIPWRRWNFRFEKELRFG